jgi:hypothetical protein
MGVCKDCTNNDRGVCLCALSPYADVEDTDTCEYYDDENNFVE